MTLYEYLKQNKSEELFVHDPYYNCESYWDYYTESECKSDLWKNSLMELAKKINIIEPSEFAKICMKYAKEMNISYRDSVTCDISDLIERNMKNIAGTDLFVKNNIDAIMWDFDNIIGGYVSESWFDKFVGVLQ